MEAYGRTEALDRIERVNRTGLAPFTAEPGSPTREELIARYEERMGSSVENVGIYRAHAAVMVATVWEDLYRHNLQAGTRSDWDPHIEYMSMLAETILSGEYPS